MTAKIDHMAQKARVSKKTALDTISTHEPAFKETRHCRLQSPEKYDWKAGPATGRRLSTNNVYPTTRLPEFLKEVDSSYTCYSIYASAKQTTNKRCTNDAR